MPLPMLKPVSVQYKSSVKQLGSDLIAVIVDEDQIGDGKLVDPTLQKLDQDLGGVVSDLAALGDFTGKWAQLVPTIRKKDSEIAPRVLLVGAGKKTDRSPARAREMGLKIGEFFGDKKIKSVALTGSSRHIAAPEHFCQAAIGLSMALYRYPYSSMSAEQKAALETPVSIGLISESPVSESLVAGTQSVIAATALCRYLQDSPPNIATPSFVAGIAKEKAEAAGLKVTIRGRAELEKLGFGAMLAVASGSAHDPQFVVIEYAPQQYAKTVAFIGKGLTMDTGGYSLKSPSTHQVGMQYDMSGAAITLASVLPIAEQKLPVRVFAIAALCENMVDAHSYRVNDVITTYAGKTVEIKNTDAEGRVVLCDALAYTAQELKPDFIFEFSTLTGAIVVTLGNYGAGVFSHPDVSAGQVVEQAAEVSGERVWSLPVWEEAVNDLKTSSVADLTNIGATAGSAGSSTAAGYLFEFVGQTPFAHIDVAGVAFGSATFGSPRKGGSGYGVQLCVEIARKLSSSN
jgi:leucyl aminopeptidase